MDELIRMAGLQIPDGISTTITSKEERRARREKALNDMVGDLGYYDCPKCRNKGWIGTVRENGTTVTWDCDCVSIRRSLRQIAKSGLSELLKIYTFDTYKADTDETVKIKAAAQKYVDDAKGWFFISGKPGSGKTHICTAICAVLLEQGRETRYVLWRETAPQLKTYVNERESYEQIMHELKTVDVLYIDDFLKGTVTDADINIAFELLNARYNNPDKLTIISTEKSIQDILDIDEALGSRIWERSTHRLKATDINRRLEIPPEINASAGEIKSKP